MAITVKGIIRKSATLETGDVTSGLLNPEQSRQFMRMAFEATPLTQVVRHEMRRARSGEIDKIGIAGRILRSKTENTDDGYRAKPNFGAVEYQAKAVRLPWEITEETLQAALYTEEQPPVDLILRPSGEYRLSNFLIWQSAYAEFVFMDVLWPDFTPEHLDSAIEEFHRRSRRFGGT